MSRGRGAISREREEGRTEKGSNVLATLLSFLPRSRRREGGLSPEKGEYTRDGGKGGNE